MTASDHGNYSTYSNYKCRCRPCTDAWNTYHRAHMKEVRRLAAIGRAVEQLTNPTRKATQQ